MNIAIIGAGLAGLTLADRLRQFHQVTVFEKARGPGGRMSTRRADPFAFDHGAQYFTADTDAFRRYLETLESIGLVRAWPKEIRLKGGARLSDKKKFVATPGMNAICKHLAADLDLRTSAHIASLEQTELGWYLRDKEGQRIGPFDWVISTAPSVQTAALLPDDFVGQSALQNTEMMGCFSLMLGFNAPLDVDWTALRSGTPPIGWMAVNSSKPDRPHAFSILIQSDNAWSEQHLEDPQEQITEILLQGASALAGHDLSLAPHQVLHRWRYAATKTPAGHAFLIDEKQKLATCGDWCLGGKVEAAFTSANALADHLISITSS